MSVTTVAPPVPDVISDATDRASHLFSILRERMGWSDQALAAWDEPGYPALKDLDQAVKALHWIKKQGLKLVVLPDFDMDGISSGVLGYAGLAELGFDVELYVPDYNRGHDIQPEALDELVARHPGVGAVITCDGGVNSHPGIQHGLDLGLVMLVTDHHVQLPGQLSPAHLVIDPERIDETYPHPGICGAFVLYQVLMAYAQRHAPHLVGDIALLKLFAGLGTVSDVMPLRYENRQLVRDSLSIARLLRHALPDADLATPYDVDKSVLMTLLNAQHDQSQRHHPVFMTAMRGFAFVLQSWREAGKLKVADGMAADFYAFYVSPAFNALRRVGAPMRVAFDVFTAPTTDLQLEAAREILRVNEQRKEDVILWTNELYMIDEDTPRLQPFAPHVWLSGAPSGMLGLLASRLMEEYQVPVVVVRDPQDPTKEHGGSARAPMWFSIIETLTGQGFTAVGHEQACGVRARDFDELREITLLLAKTTADLQAAMLVARLGGDAEHDYDLALGAETPNHTVPDGPLCDNEALLEMASRIDSLAPFGHGFPRPRFRLVVDLSQCTLGLLGAEEKHVKILMPNGLKLLWWNSADQLLDLKDVAEAIGPGESTVEFDADVSINRFMGMESPQATIRRLVQPLALLDDPQEVA